MTMLVKEGHFDSAHRLILPYKSKCRNIHGHRWNVTIQIITNTETEQRINGMVVDFVKIGELINKFDHKTILWACNENKEIIEFFKKHNLGIVTLDCNPTAENLAKIFKIEIIKLLKKEYKNIDISNAFDVNVEIQETPTSSIVE